MKIVIAPDSFKGSLSSLQAALAIKRGVTRAAPKSEIIIVPAADGGEGTLDSLLASVGGHRFVSKVAGPMGEYVTAEYGVIDGGDTCIIEMAAASGLCLVQEGDLNPMLATTYGTGQLIKRGLDKGMRSFILAIGGSATIDGGTGMLKALGVKLIDSEGKETGLGGKSLRNITAIDVEDFDPRIKESRFLIASDVQNPLIGQNGASYVFGPQKGATPEMVEELDRSLSHWADLVEEKTGIRLHERAGAGAAGGLGGAFQAFFPSHCERGIDVVMRYSKLEEKMEDASCVFTGEGRIDYQTASGKTPLGIAQAAKERGIPVFALTGSAGEGTDDLHKHGITSIHSIVNAPMSLQEAISRAPELLEKTACQVMKAFLAGASKK